MKQYQRHYNLAIKGTDFDTSQAATTLQVCHLFRKKFQEISEREEATKIGKGRKLIDLVSDHQGPLETSPGMKLGGRTEHILQLSQPRTRQLGYLSTKLCQPLVQGCSWGH